MITSQFKSMYLDFTKVEKSTKKVLCTSWEKHRVEYLSQRKDRMLCYMTFPFRKSDFPIFKVSGRHKTTRITCGQYQSSSYACKEHPVLSIVHKKISCSKLGCPVCVGGASTIRARKIASRLEAITNEIKLSYKDIGLAKHLSFNIKIPKIIDYEKFKWLQKGIIKIAQEAGLHSGVIFHHSVRIDEENKELYESHHFHLIAYGHVINSDKFFKKFRFTYRNHGDRADYSHVVGTIQYILSHSGLYFYKLMRKTKKCWDSDYPGCRKICKLKFKCRDRSLATQHKQSYKYFGVFAPHNCSAKIIDKIDVKAECPVCEEPLFEILEGLTLRFILNPLAEKKLKKLEKLNKPAIFNKYYVKNSTYKDGMWIHEKGIKQIKTTVYHYEIEELRRCLIIDTNQNLWHSEKDLTFSDYILWEKKNVYLVTIRRNLYPILRVF